MNTPPRSTRLLLAIIATMRWGNWLCLALFAGALIFSIVSGEQLIARLAVKYGQEADTRGAVHLMQAIMAVGILAVFVVDRLLRALAAVANSVGAGNPFDPANARHLHIVGLMLLVLQLLDLGMGGAALAARHLHVDFVDWQPSFTGWVAVLVAFVLAHVFRAGAVMRDDLDGTV